MTRIEALRKYLEGVISTMDYNLSQHREGDHWPWPETYEHAKGRISAYSEIRSILRE